MLVLVEIDALDSAVPMARWLTDARGAQGGWQTTQDTVVALEALASYAARVYATQGEITVVVAGDGGAEIETVVLTAANRDLVTTVVVPRSAAPSSLSVTASGDGICVVSAVVAWNEPEPDRPSPPIAVATLLVAKDDAGAVLQCTVCAEVTAAAAVAEDPRGRIAIFTIKMFSGFVADMAATRGANEVRPLASRAKLVENNGAKGVTFYVDELQAERPRCHTLTLRRQHRVKRIQPVAVAVADYYEPSISADVLVSYDDQAPDGTVIDGMVDGDDDDGATGGAAASVISFALATVAVCVSA